MSFRHIFVTPIMNRKSTNFRFINVLFEVSRKEIAVIHY